MSLAEAEIADQMESAKQEMHATSAQANAVQSETKPPLGVSRRDFAKWKEQQATAARQRLSELDQRLQRLQMLRSKLSQMKANADLTAAQSDRTLGDIGAAAAKTFGQERQFLPGQPDLPTQNQSHTTNAAGNAQWSTFEDADGDLDSPDRRDGDDDEEIPSGNYTRMPAYLQPPYQPGMPPPFTPGFSGLRKIIRDEMAVVVSQVVDGSSKKPTKRDDEEVDAEPLRPQTGGRPRTTTARQAWTAASSEYPEQDDLPVDQTKKKKSNLMPKTLDDAEQHVLSLIFGGFSRQSLLRIKCFEIMRSGAWQGFFYVNTLLSCILAAVVVEMGYVGSSRVVFLEVLEIYFNCVFAFELLIGIVALGLFNGPTTFLRVTGMNVLDCMILLGTIVEYAMQQAGSEGITVKAFRIMRMLRVLSFFRAFSGIRSFIGTLQASAGQLATVFFVIIFVIAGFSTLLLTFLRENFSRRCVVVDQHLSSCSSDFSTGWALSPECDLIKWTNTLPNTLDANKPETDYPVMIDDYYPFERWCKIEKNASAGQYDGNPLYDLDFKGRYHTCGQKRQNYRPGSEMCAEVGNPSYSFSHFDDFGGALVTLAQGSAPDSYYDVLWRSIQSEPYWKGGLIVIYMMLTLIVTWLLIGIFVAVVTGTFKVVREEHIEEERAEEEKMQQEQLDFFLAKGHANHHLWNSKKSRDKQDAKLRKVLEDRREKAVEFKNDTDQVREFDADVVNERHSSHFIDEILSGWAEKVLDYPRYNHAVSFCIVGHSFAMMCDQYDAPPTWRSYSQWSYIVFNGLFFVDLSIRVFAAGDFNTFFEKNKNTFEFLLVMTSMIGLAANAKFLILMASLRVYHLMRYLPTLNNLLILAIGSLKPLSNLMVFILTSSLAVAVTGRYVFGDSMDSITRSNFGSFFEAMITVFQLLTGDSWSGVVYASMASMPGRGSMIFAGVFILIWFVFSSLIVNNLFVAVIIENFEVSETIENIANPGHISALRQKIQSSWRNLLQAKAAVERGDIRINVDDGGRAYDPIENSLVLRRSNAVAAMNGEDQSMRLEVLKDKHQVQQHPKQLQNTTDLAEGFQGSIQSLLDDRRGSAMGGRKAKRSHLLKVVKWATVRYRTQEEDREETYERVLFCLWPESRIRKFFVWLGEKKWFDAAIYASILVSCIFLILEPPSGISTEDIQRIDPSWTVRVEDRTARFCSYLFTFVFTAEFLVKVLDRGLYFTKRAYLKDAWNVLDSIILIISLANVLIDLMSLDSFKGGRVGKVLRLGRALRPLRLMKRNESMRVVIDALIGTLYPVAYVLLFLLWTMLVFSLIGMGLFGGMYHYCSTQDLLSYTTDPVVAYPGGKRECMGFFVRDDGVLIQRAWNNPPYHFDTFYNSMKTLFVVQTLKFVSIMQQSMDLTEFNHSPSRNANVYFALFFVVYVFVGGLFVMNLFVGFIVDGFNIKKGSSEEEIHFNAFLRSISIHKPHYKHFALPPNFVSQACRSLIDNRSWQSFSSACVAVNVIFNLTDHRGAAEYYEDIIDLQNNIFNYVLFFEVFVAMVGWGPGGFLDDRWKLFDAFVAVGSITGMVVQNPMITKFSKAFRLVRILRLMIMIKAIRVILETLVAVLPQLINIMLLLLLVYSIFSVVGMQLFGVVRPGLRFGGTADFYTYETSLLTIFQVVTGDEWHILMYDHAIEYPKCTPTFNEETVPGWTAWKGKPFEMGDCGSEGMSFTFWILTKIVCEQVMLNLFIGMILDNFSFITDEVTHVEDDKWTAGASARQIREIVECFQMFDQRSCTIAISAMPSFLCSLPHPLGFRRRDGKLCRGPWEKAVQRLIQAELNILVRHKRETLLKAQINSWNPLVKISNKHQDRIHRVEFVDFIKTVLYWRKPDMVPYVIKATRWKRVDEVILTAYALVICDCLKNQVSGKIYKTTLKKLSALKEFKDWERKDEARTRRLEVITREIQAEKRLAKMEKKNAIDQYWIPTDTIRMVFESVSELPEDMVSHHAAVRANKIKVPKPINGLQAFRNFSENHLVTMKFVDPKHCKSGYVLVDFTTMNFNGWEVINTPTDTFLIPKTRRTKPSEVALPWTQIEAVMFKGKSLLARSREKKLGSLLDIQSYTYAEGNSRQELLQSATSRVRFNLGVMRRESLARDETGYDKFEAGPNEVFFVEDTILEVVGYTPLAVGVKDQMQSHVERSQRIETAAKMAATQDSATSLERPGKGLKDVDTVVESTGVREESGSEDDNQYAKDLKLAEAGNGKAQDDAGELAGKRQQREEVGVEEMEDEDKKAGTGELIPVAPKLSREGRRKTLINQ